MAEETKEKGEGGRGAKGVVKGERGYIEVVKATKEKKKRERERERRDNVTRQ